MKKMNLNTIHRSEEERLWGEAFGREFPLPDAVAAAKQSAFREIRARAVDAAGETTVEYERQQDFSKGNDRIAAIDGGRNFRIGQIGMRIGRMAASVAAAAAVFSGICIANPALAAQIPLVGHVFEEIGNSLRNYPGDYSSYAEVLTESGADGGGVEEAEGSAPVSETDAAVSESNTAASGAYSQTANGVTITLSEVYCNDEALSISMLITSEEGFEYLDPNDENPYLTFEYANAKGSFNTTLPEDGVDLADIRLDGTLIDENTFAAVYRIPMDTLSTDMESRIQYSEDGVVDMEAIAEKLGLEDASEITDEAVKAAGGPSYESYDSVVEIPDSFTIDLSFTTLYGLLPEDMVDIPEMPQELQDEYDAAMAEYGLDMADYADFTEEERDIERKFYHEMYQKYYELYPDMQRIGGPNQYCNWWLEGTWEFTLDVTKNTADTLIREVDLTDDSGFGIASVTRTPMELSVAAIYPEDVSGKDYVVVVLDADGAYMGLPDFQDLSVAGYDTSVIKIFICDYVEFMDELKGYLVSDDYEESGAKTAEQLLTERAVYCTEVTLG